MLAFYFCVPLGVVYPFKGGNRFELFSGLAAALPLEFDVYCFILAMLTFLWFLILISCEEPVADTGGLGNGFVVDFYSIRDEDYCSGGCWSSITPVRNVVDVSGYWKVIGWTGSLSRLAFCSLEEVKEELASSCIVSIVGFYSSLF